MANYWSAFVTISHEFTVANSYRRQSMKYPKVNLGQVEAVWNKLGGEEGVARFLRNESRVVIDRHIIDLDASPFVPEGWKVEEHKQGGQFEWDPTKVALHLADGQQNGIVGTELRKLLEGQPVMNANLLDYLLKNPQLIPEDWKGKAAFFWGTVYRFDGGRLCVRYLLWNGSVWFWCRSWLVDSFVAFNPAFVLAASQDSALVP